MMTTHRVTLLHRTYLRALMALTLAALGGCATYNGILNATGHLSRSAVVLPVPFEKQASDNLCGLAVADMVSRYYGVPLPRLTRRRLLQDTQTRGGISGRDLKAAFAQAGYTALLFPGDLGQDAAGIYRHLERRRPLIVMFGSGKRSPGHYLVVAGYDPARRTLVMLDPEFGRRIESRRTFLRDWTPSGRFTLLVIPKARAEGAATPR